MNTIGYFRRVNAAEIANRRAAARWRMQIGIEAQRARILAERRIADLHASVSSGRRLDVIATELRALADEIEAA